MNEPVSDEVRKHIEALLEGGFNLLTVDLALPEALNAAKDLMQTYSRLKIFESKALYREALDLALSQNITVYDAL